jgi:hypothetical protein
VSIVSKDEKQQEMLDERTVKRLLESVQVETTAVRATDPAGAEIGSYEAFPQDQVQEVVRSLVDQGGLPEGSYGLYAQGPDGNAVRLSPDATLGDSLASLGLETSQLDVVLAPELQGNR